MTHAATAMALARAAFPSKMAGYSGESFDVMQHIAQVLTDADRKSGADAPRYGYSAANFEIARNAVCEWRGR